AVRRQLRLQGVGDVLLEVHRGWGERHERLRKRFRLGRRWLRWIERRRLGRLRDEEDRLQRRRLRGGRRRFRRHERRRRHPNVHGHQVEACRATEFWPDGGGAETWPPNAKTTPIAFDSSACAIGKQSGNPGSTFWTFDLTQLAQPWGKNPNSNFGVVLYPVIP